MNRVSLPQTQLMMAGTMLLCAALAFGYRWHFAAAANSAAGLQSLGTMLRIEADSASAARAPTGEAVQASLPDLLGQAQKAASDDNVSIRGVVINPTDAKRATLKVQGSFRDVMQFLGRLETFQISLNGFEFAPDENGITGTIDLAYTGKPGAPASFVDYLDAMVRYSAVRNPFEAGDPVPLPEAGSALGDLSWTYHLTGIWQAGAERMATIDGRDYRPGDHFQGMEILAVDPSSVRLSAPNQKIVQTLHFRRNPAEQAHG